MTDSYRLLCEKHRKKDRIEKFLSIPEILIFLKGGGPLRKIKIRKNFYIFFFRGPPPPPPLEKIQNLDNHGEFFNAVFFPMLFT